jgi:YHS domain-containing protein
MNVPRHEYGRERRNEMNRRNGSKQRILALALLLGLTTAPLLLAEEHTAGEVALDGYCPVAYSAMQKAVKGNPKFASEYKGRTYYLANGKAKKMLDQAPQDFSVAYDGLCATGMAHGMKVESDPKLFVVRDGTTYRFSNEEAMAMFTKDATQVISKADGNWSSLAHQGH